MSAPQTSAKSIFLQALELTTSMEREAYLDTHCGDDSCLRREVDELLRHCGSVGTFLESPPTAVVGSAELLRNLAPATPSLGFLEPSSRDDALGRLGHYEVLEVVGSGGMGIVLKAFDTQLQRIVAIKALAPTTATPASGRQRFVREAQAAAAVNHDNVVDIYAVQELGPVPYLVMEYIGGTSLEDKLNQRSPLELKEILRIGLQTADGLAAAHRQGLVHRDVKPANILLENGVGRVKITDFGLARIADDVSVTQTGVIAGTPGYMSPEQARGDTIDHRSDLFSLGSVLYTMCTGRAPFRSSTSLGMLRQVCDDQPHPIRDLNPDIPESLCAIIGKLHAKHPADRFQSATELAEMLGGYLAHVQHPSNPLPTSLLGQDSCRAEEQRQSGLPGDLPSPSRRRWALAAVAALVMLGLTLSLTEAGGVTQMTATVIRILTPEGTLVVETDDPAVNVTIAGDGGLVITGAGPQEVRLKPGSYKLQADKDGQPVPLEKELVSIIRGGREVVKVKLASTSAHTGPLESGGPARSTWPKGTPPPAVAPFDGAGAKEHQQAWAKHLGVPDEYTDSIGMKFRLIPPGEFVMGTREEDRAALLRQRPEPKVRDLVLEHLKAESHPKQVQIAQPFYIGVFEVTHSQFARFVAETGYKTDGERSGDGGWGHADGKWERRATHLWNTPGSWNVTDSLPVVHVSVHDAVAFCAWLSKKEGREYVLPSEAHWEFAARAGTTGLYGTAGGQESLDVIAWWNGNLRDGLPDQPQPVGGKRANAFGLHDTLGNIWEWCADRHQPNSGLRVKRGGSWYTDDVHVRVNVRGTGEPHKASDAGSGFRVAIVGELKPSAPPSAAVAKVERGAFVLLGGEGVAERKFDALVEAVQAGKDLGADVALVGPGAAYERWKETPEYQQWLKDTRQAK